MNAGFSDAPVCQYCGHQSRRMTGAELYNRSGERYSDKPFYVCKPCGAHVGCHPGTVIPLGTLANKELRNARNHVHKKLDPLWLEYPKGKRRKDMRGGVYAYLADKMQIDREACHTAMFDLEQCREAYRILRDTTSDDVEAWVAENWEQP